MNTNRLNAARCRAAGTTALAVWLIGAALLFSGCATRRQVAEIVAQSNSAVLAAQFGALPEPGGAATAQPWQEASARIDAFVEAHPDQPAIAAPLRVRQAMLLLAFRQFPLAQAAFNAAAANDLHTERDQALKRNQETLLWWFASSTNDVWSAQDQAQGQAALKNLKEEQDRLRASPEIRDYLAEMRAWIGLAAAKQTTSAERAKAIMEDALNTYAETFTPADLEGLGSGGERNLNASALGPDLRRRLRARAILEQARKQNEQDHLEVHPSVGAFDRAMHR